MIIFGVNRIYFTRLNPQFLKNFETCINRKTTGSAKQLEPIVYDTIENAEDFLLIFNFWFEIFYHKYGLILKLMIISGNQKVKI